MTMADPFMTLALANTICTAALATGRERSFQPLVVAVLDAGGGVATRPRQRHAADR